MSSKRIYPTKLEYTPYTYLIGWSETNTFYYGVKYAKFCHPSTFFIDYFTSSDVVEEYLKEHGDPDIIEIRKTFDNSEDAIKYERTVLRRMRVVFDKRFLNKRDASGNWPYLPKKFTRETIPSKEELIKLYIDEKKSRKFLARHYDTHLKMIKEMLNHYDIPIRTHQEQCTIFNNDPVMRQSMIEKITGRSLPESTKANMKKSAKRGEENINFHGWYLSPWGTFASLSTMLEHAPKEFDFKIVTLFNWCKKYPEKRVNHLHISHSKYLKSLNLDHKNSPITFKDLGFYFIHVET